MDWKDRIEINPKVLVGKPVIRGTRISVELVLQMIAAGVSEAKILHNYPSLSPQDLRASVAYAAKNQGKSVSRLVADDFELLDRPPREEPLPPLTRSLFGVAAGSELTEEDYRLYLEEKHR